MKLIKIKASNGDVVHVNIDVISSMKRDTEKGVTIVIGLALYLETEESIAGITRKINSAK